MTSHHIVVYTTFKEKNMDFNSLGEGLKLVEQAACILETISNEPGVTPSEFYDALDLQGILDYDQRSILAQAAATVEMTLEMMPDSKYSTIN